MIELKVEEQATVKVIFGFDASPLVLVTNKEAMLHLEQKRRDTQKEIANLRESLEKAKCGPSCFPTITRLKEELREARKQANISFAFKFPPIDMPTPEKIAESLKFALGRRLAAEWQPIETAPKDGSWVLLGRFDGMWATTAVCFWSNQGWQCQIGMITTHGLPEATHWMSLPARPK